ncbi:hypothetical protein [Intrasporangium sp.]|uniref:hypothetical protein n=1 Tax=Intrasporangium sp. TaxID=1925024 RepID=UPI00293B5B90|nr:hypothetical protein [Intrasporangium sp.]MDV3222824.1 hypothetical protein [Intrasporangium sp.]
MTDRIVLAARNNALWCDVVCRTHGLAGVLDDLAWTCPSRTPPYYPDAVTLSPEAAEHDLLARIAPGDGASIKDSWSRLDLAAENFARLVVGEWLWWDAPEAVTAGAQPDGGATTNTSTDGRTWRRVRSLDEAAAWSRAWASADPADAGILRPELVTVPGVHLLAAGSAGDDFAAGCIVNVTGPVAGVSNLFGRQGDDALTWRAATAAVREVVGALPLVGWEAGAGLEAAVAAGATRLGPLTVWIS